MTWLTGWTRRKIKIIENLTVSDYQMKLIIHKTGLGPDTSTDIYLGGHCRDDFADLRFTGPDQITLLSYWIESITGTTPNLVATVWIKIPTLIPINNIYIYYDNPTATSTASNYQSFWLVINGDFESNVTFPEPVIGFTKAWTGNQSGYGVYTGPYGEDARNPDRTPIQGTYALQNRIGSWDWTGTTWYYQDVSLPNEDNIIIEMLAASGFKQNNVYGSIDIIENAGTGASHNIWPTSNGGNIPWGWISYNVSPYKNTTVRLKILTGAGGGALGRDYNLFVDFIRIRKYTSPEPTFGVSGTEELGITATLMTLNTNTCAGPCQIIAGVTWQNLGGSSITFRPTILIDGTTYVQAASDITIGPYPAEGSSTITTPTLSIGTYQICPYPN